MSVVNSMKKGVRGRERECLVRLETIQQYSRLKGFIPVKKGNE